MEGNANPCQSSDDPLRTINALLNAANIMVTAKSTTKWRSKRAAGEYSSARARYRRMDVGSPVAIARLPLARQTARSICGGSWTVVAITNDTPLRYSTLLIYVRDVIVASYCSYAFVLPARCEVCITVDSPDRTLDPVLIWVLMITTGSYRRIVKRRRRGGAPLQ